MRTRHQQNRRAARVRFPLRRSRPERCQPGGSNDQHASPPGVKVLVPIEFSRSSGQALQFVTSLARRFRMTVILLHVLKPAFCEADFGYGSVLRQLPNESLHNKAERKLRSLGRRVFGTHPAFATVVQCGDQEKAIVDVAQRLAADLVVLSNASLAGEPEKLLQHASCPVLVLPAHYRSALVSQSTRRTVL